MRNAHRMGAFTLALAVASPLAAVAQSPPPHSPALPPNCTKVTQPFVGTLCVPKIDTGKHPAMILLGGSEGGDAMSAAAPAFAAHGYVAASVAYFGMPGLPQNLVDVPVETVARALDALTHRPDVQAARIGVLGVSKGGELALLAASSYPRIVAVVAIVPSPVGFFGLGENGIPSGCSWSRAGAPLPCVPADPVAGQKIGMAFSTGGPIVLKDLYDASLAASPEVTKAAFFPLERIGGPVLCLAAADDQLWNSPAQCKLATAYLQSHHHAYLDPSIVYPNAGHTFFAAFRGPSSAITEIDVGAAKLMFGGTKEGDAIAAQAAWPVIWSFLAKRLQ